MMIYIDVSVKQKFFIMFVKRVKLKEKLIEYGKIYFFVDKIGIKFRF